MGGFYLQCVDQQNIRRFKGGNVIVVIFRIIPVTALLNQDIMSFMQSEI
jgi:hypothetical protein